MASKTRVGSKAEIILDAIPSDDWVTSRAVADVVGMSPRSVGATIGYELLYRHVKRRPTNHSAWEYQRISSGLSYRIAERSAAPRSASSLGRCSVSPRLSTRS